MKFIFDDESNYYTASSAYSQRHNYSLYILKTDEDQPDIEMEFSIIQENAFDLISDLVIKTEMKKLQKIIILSIMTIQLLILN